MVAAVAVAAAAAVAVTVVAVLVAVTTAAPPARTAGQGKWRASFMKGLRVFRISNQFTTV